MESAMTFLLRSTLVLSLVAGGAIAALGVGNSLPPVNVSRGDLAAGGYDTVAYHTDGRATRGDARFEHRWNGAIWRFATDANRQTFLQDPARYAPEFGGYCAYAVSRGYTADGDPEVWRIVDGRLYLNYSRRAQRLWEEDIPGNIAKGRRNWPGVLSR
jgi:hypothetical protein